MESFNIVEKIVENCLRNDFKTLLLNGPTFSKKQLDKIAKARKAINQWRTK